MRGIVVAGISRSPDGTWVEQLARNLTSSDGGFLTGCRYLIHDRDPLFTESFDVLLASADVKATKLPA